MKKIIYLLISALVIYVFLLVSCKPKPEPTEPGFTSTKTFTPIPINTETPVNSFTQTPTSTFVFSETFTPTSTTTFTITETVTITPTITPTLTPTVCTIYYFDADRDGYGICDNYICSTSPHLFYDTTACGDCADNNAQIYPGRSEICGNNIDDNCEGNEDEGCSP